MTQSTAPQPASSEPTPPEGVNTADDGPVSDYDLGYEDGFEGHTMRILNGSEVCKGCYATGWTRGMEDRMEIQRSGSSNT